VLSDGQNRCAVRWSENSDVLRKDRNECAKMYGMENEADGVTPRRRPNMMWKDRAVDKDWISLHSNEEDALR